MSKNDADALVLFGAGGDLAAKMIYPALHALAQRGQLTVPVIGVGRGGWDRLRFVEHVRASVQSHARIDDTAFDALGERLDYVDGDLRQPATLDKVRQAQGPAQRPLYYLAIPPDAFAAAVEGDPRIS